ncbi:hypothetical protein K1X84_14705 [bacterium]|nr:hypothetical protein [bacterium]
MPTIPHVIIIHGLADVSKSWNRLKPLLSRHDFIPHFFEYPTFKNDLDIPRIVKRLRDFIANHIGSHPFQIIAHSQGGLVSEWYDAFENTGSLKRIVTIGTPFHGNMIPALAPRTIIRHLPFSRQQVKGLGCYSSIILKLMQHRSKSATEYISFIGLTGKTLNIEGDRLVSSCEANRNAIIYRSGKLLPISKAATLIYMKKSHWPLSYIRTINKPGDEFARRLLLALDSRPQPPTILFPNQSALVIGENHFDSLTGHDKAILNKRTWEKNFRLLYFNSNEMEIKIAGQKIEILPGWFTYYV